ncbi:hypothetical protein AAG906_019408 [Vitis piasezkii]
MTTIEEMAGIDVLCSDKARTLTLNKLTIDKNLVKVFIKGMEKEYVILLAAGASRIENQDSIDAVIVRMIADLKETKWATVIVWLYCSDKVAESSWYGDVILDAGCQNIAPNLVSVQPPSTIVHPSETRQDLVR